MHPCKCSYNSSNIQSDFQERFGLVAKLPSVSAKHMILALKKAGFEIYRQRGNHITLVNESIDKQVTIPMHKILKPGTLHNVLKQAGISRDELRKLL